MPMKAPELTRKSLPLPPITFSNPSRLADAPPLIAVDEPRSRSTVTGRLQL